MSHDPFIQSFYLSIDSRMDKKIKAYDKVVSKQIDGLLVTMVDQMNNTKKEQKKEIKNTVNALIVKALNAKFAIFALYLACSGILLFAVYYMNDKAIKSSLEVNMGDYKKLGVENSKAIKKLSEDMKSLIKMHKKEDKRELGSLANLTSL